MVVLVVVVRCCIGGVGVYVLSSIGRSLFSLFWWCCLGPVSCFVHGSGGVVLGLGGFVEFFILVMFCFGDGEGDVTVGVVRVM